ncbi:rhodanese-like domain-containing protein [Fulvivirgaceae bacterium BMA10]|uniref:Rhodanese-like domain-containing protein n=1 Tax=Splendidivirga corallicola TaxID=3051826 RepID=A0ABT8KLK9_9BACT|nr:rhodanese-like domain-containing protein [Fulvivirgaceae bacterium BMA10]
MKVHIYLTSLMMVVLLPIWSCSQSKSSENTNIRVDEVKKTLDEQRDVVLMDVRTPGEVKNGTLPGVDEIIDFRAPDFKGQIQKLDKGKTYFVYCHSGMRSGKTVAMMKEIGFKNVFNVEGGIAEWKEKGYEIK